MIPNLQRITAMREPQLRRPAPSDWERFTHASWWHWYKHKPTGLRVMLSLDTVADESGNESRWLHLSASMPTRIPNWYELKAAKDAFIGRDHEAVQVLPKDRDFVNYCKNCLHLWSPEP